MTKYNWRTNRATWCVSVHFNPSSIEELESVKLSIEEMYDNIESDFIKDIIDLNEINWNELKASIATNNE